jgi:uncharacterized protein (DUF2336 family)
VRPAAKGDAGRAERCADRRAAPHSLRQALVHTQVKPEPARTAHKAHAETRPRDGLLNAHRKIGTHRADAWAAGALAAPLTLNRAGKVFFFFFF